MKEKELIQIVKDYRRVYPKDTHSDAQIKQAAINTQNNELHQAKSATNSR